MTIFDANGQRKYLTLAEREAFITAAESAAREVRTFCWTLAPSGCRISEALALTADRIDLKDGRIVFESLKKRRRGIYRAVPVALIVVLMGCGGEADAVVRTPPKVVTRTFSTAEEAFNTMLNSGDRNIRYTATQYLRRQKEDVDRTINGYGNILFKVSDEEIRKRVYESMGWFGRDTVSILIAHLIQEPKIPLKMEIVRALGEIGPDAKDSLTAIERVSGRYARLAEGATGNGKVVVQSSTGEYEIDPNDKDIAETFRLVAQDAMAKIRGAAK